MTLNKAVTTFLIAAGALSAPGLRAEESARFDYGVNFKLTAQSTEDLDLGTRDEGDFNGLGFGVRP